MSASRSGRRRFVLPLVAGALVFTVGTAFASALTVNSKTLGSGNAAIATCNATASVTYNTAYSATIPGYKVTTAPVASSAACALMSYRVTLTGAANASLGEVVGTLTALGAATPDFTASNVVATSVVGVSVSITG